MIGVPPHFGEEAEPHSPTLIVKSDSTPLPQPGGRGVSKQGQLTDLEIVHLVSGNLSFRTISFCENAGVLSNKNKHFLA